MKLLRGWGWGDVFTLASFENRSGCRILDLFEFVKKMFLKNLIEEIYSSQVLTKQKAQRRVFVASIVR